MNTYTKLSNGNWGLRIQSGQTRIQSGDSIVVTKKSGETKNEKVGKIVWTGNGVTLATIAPLPARYGSYSTIGERTRERMDRTGWTGCSCGSIEGHPRPSDCASCRFDND
jgi:hypothetical protein